MSSVRAHKVHAQLQVFPPTRIQPNNLSNNTSNIEHRYLEPSMRPSDTTTTTTTIDHHQPSPSTITTDYHHQPNHRLPPSTMQLNNIITHHHNH
jgi:hypothetical protein